MTGMDLILTSLCVNITCDLIRSEKSPSQVKSWIENCFPNGACENVSLPNQTDVAINTVDNNFTSRELKEFQLEGIRQKLNGTTLKIVTLEDFPLSYKKIDSEGNVRYKGVAFQILDFLAEKFNFKYDVMVPPGNKFGSTDDMTDSLIEMVNKTQAVYKNIVSFGVKNDSPQFSLKSSRNRSPRQTTQYFYKPLPANYVVCNSPTTEQGYERVFTHFKKNADMVAAFLPIISDARTYIDYSTTTLDEGEWIMIMKRPAESATGSGLLAPFDANVWILIMVSLFAVGPIIYGLIIARNKLTRDASQKNYSLPHCIWFVYGAIMKQGSTLSPVADSTRLLFATWWIFITILTSFYTANLTAFLTLSKFTLPINNVDDIIKKDKHFVAQRGGGVEYAIRNPNEALSQLLKMVENKRGIFTDTFNDTETLLRYVQKNDYVYIRDRPAINHLIYKDYVYRKTISNEEKIHCPFAISKTPFMTRKRAFAYPRNSSWSYLFDPELLHLVESGIVKYMLWENLPNSEICPQNLAGTERQLRNGDLLMTYQIMIAGFCTSIVVFMTEMIFRFLNYRQKKTNLGNDGFYKKIDKLVIPSVTPPPPYATIYNRSRNNNIWTLSETDKKNMEGATQFINGRQYMVVKGDHGEQRLIPLRTPSAAIFQYSYTK